MICRTNKPAERRGKILFIEAKHFVERKNGETMMTADHIDAVAKAYVDFETVPGLSYVASNDEVQRNGDSMSVSLYVKGSAEDSMVDMSSALSGWKEQSRLSAESVDAFKAHL